MVSGWCCFQFENLHNVSRIWGFLYGILGWGWNAQEEGCTQGTLMVRWEGRLHSGSYPGEIPKPIVFPSLASWLGATGYIKWQNRSLCIRFGEPILCQCCLQLYPIKTVAILFHIYVETLYAYVLLWYDGWWDTAWLHTAAYNRCWDRKLISCLSECMFTYLQRCGDPQATETPGGEFGIGIHFPNHPPTHRQTHKHQSYAILFCKDSESHLLTLPF